MDADVRDLLDGPGDSNAKSGCDVIATRDDACPQHGPYVAQQIRLRPSRVPYWLPCPHCQAEWERRTREEERLFKRCIAGTPEWSPWGK
jgi:hypothetical protein